MESKLIEILELAQHLIRIPAFSIGPEYNPEGINECFGVIVEFLKKAGLRVLEFREECRAPALYTDLGKDGEPLYGDLLLAGHFDRVSPHTPEQSRPKIENDWLIGRGAADMLAVVSTYLVFVKDLKLEKPSPLPRIGLLLIGNEEPGEPEKWGTVHVLTELRKKYQYSPKLMIAGERTGEGKANHGKIELKNRGVIRICMETSQEPAHSGLLKGQAAADRMLSLITFARKILPEPRNRVWKSTQTVSYIHAGETGNFNTLPAAVEAGLEIRPVPEDNMEKLVNQLQRKAGELNIQLRFVNMEAGVSSPPGNPQIQILVQAVQKIYGGEPSDRIGKGKLPGTQARFAPDECAAVVFGQSGKGPHSPNEAHYIPSIIPYYRVLKELAGAYQQYSPPDPPQRRT